MRRGPLVLLTSLALAGVSTASAGVQATPSPPATSLDVTLSTQSAGARPVAVTLKVHAELQCGRLTGGPLAFRFPAAERLPKSIASTDVKIAGQPAKAVAVDRRNVTVTLKPRTGVMCDVIAPGTVSVVLGKTANVGNPMSAGLYTVTLMRGQTAAAAQFRVR